MKVVDLTREHLRSIKVREIERVDLGDNLSDHENIFLESQFKKVIIQDDEVVVIMGGVIEGETCHTWLLASDLIYSFPIATMKLIKRLHNESRDLFNIKFFYTYNLPSFDREVKFVESLGYTKKDLYDFEDGKKRILLQMEV